MSATWKAAIEQEYVEASLPFVLLNLLIGGGTSASSSSSSEKKPKSGGEGEKKKKNAEASGSEDASGSKGKGSSSKKSAKEERKRLAEAEAAAAAAAVLDKVLKPEEIGVEPFGAYPLIQSQRQTGRVWTEIKDLTPDLDGKEVLVRSRVHTSRSKGKMCFLLLRSGFYSAQVALFVGENGVTKDMVKFVSSIPKESIVDVVAVVRKSPTPIASASQDQIELAALRVYLVNKSSVVLPLLVEDASKPEPDEDVELPPDSNVIRVNPDVRLDHRVLDLRVPAHVGIFRIQSAVGQLFREYLLTQNFVEIHTPKMIGAASEGGANVFKVSYFGGNAFLAQSPQLYKEMAVQGDLMRVFEVAPVFRAENSNTPRHLTEFVGLDAEMDIKEHYSEVLDVADDMFVFMFEQLELRFAAELKAIRAQYGGEPLKFRRGRNLRLTFQEGVRLLKEAGYDQHPLEDLDTPNEKALGRIVREKYDTDFYILEKYPRAARPFYTMPCPEDPRYSNSYDIMLRGQEISSGAQRIHDPEMLEASMRALKIDPKPLEAYIESTRYGGWPHGGFGIGLERLVMLFVGLPGVRKTSMFPRTPVRIFP